MGEKGAVGLIGLGIMGSAFAQHLKAAGWRVIGFDSDAGCRSRAAAGGVEITDNNGVVARQAETILIVVPTPAALDAVAGEIAAAQVPRRLVIEMGTFSLETKLRAAETLKAAGHDMLDCPVSGTGAQARNKDLLVFVSGEAALAERARPVFADFAREVHHVGALGNGTRMKLVTNHLVAVHLAAAGEALTLGMRAGLDPAQVLQLATSGPAGSRMLQLRGPMMVENRYDGPNISARTAILVKDIGTIGDFADDLHCPTPMLNAAKALFASAMATGHSDHDPASVCAVSEALAGSRRKPG